MKKNSEGGYIVVETMLAFVPFVFVIISILSLVNIVTVQARVHYAITQAADTISMYSYVLQATGAIDLIHQNEEQAGKVQDTVDASVEDINKVMDAIQDIANGKANYEGLAEGAIGTANQISKYVEGADNDPKTIIQNLIQYALHTGKNIAFGKLVEPLVGRYLANGSMSGDEYLKAAHVVGGLKGLDFSQPPISTTVTDEGYLNIKSGDVSSSFLDNDEITIVVRYEVEYTCGPLPLPFTNLKIQQEVKTKAWLGGRDGG